MLIEVCITHVALEFFFLHNIYIYIYIYIFGFHKPTSKPSSLMLPKPKGRDEIVEVKKMRSPLVKGINLTSLAQSTVQNVMIYMGRSTIAKESGNLSIKSRVVPSMMLMEVCDRFSSTAAGPSILILA